MTIANKVQSNSRTIQKISVKSTLMAYIQVTSRDTMHTSSWFINLGELGDSIEGATYQEMLGGVLLSCQPNVTFTTNQVQHYGSY